mgnify:FL=1
MGKMVVGEIDAKTDRLLRISEARRTVGSRAVDLKVAADEHKAAKLAYDTALGALLNQIDAQPLPLLDEAQEE